MQDTIRNEAKGHAPEMPTACGLLRRLGAILYDTLLLFAVLMIAGGLYLWAFGEQAIGANHPFYTLYLTAVSLAFFGGFWTHGGQTLGMRAWGIRVVSTEGAPVPWPLAIARFFVAMLSWTLAGAGFWCALFNREKLALHDVVSRTRLLHIPKQRPQS